MRLNRRQFDALAKLIRTSLSDHGHSSNACMALRELAEGLADIFAGADANFNRPSFLQKCGFEPAQSQSAPSKEL